ncbi:MAG: SPOR domain-containing protein [Oceanidesulfovibrio sp.]
MSNRPLILVCLVCAAVLAGCGTRSNYYHPKKPVSAWDQDMSHCRDTAKFLLETGRGLSGGGMQAEIKDCMQAKGYHYGADAPPVVDEVSASATDTAQTEYNVLESTWHTEQLAQERLDYLRRTDIRGAFIRPHPTAEGTWYRVLIGSRETLSGAKQLQYELWHEHNLRHTYIVKRD